MKISASQRKLILVLGETLLLWLACLPITGYEEFAGVLAQDHGGFGSLPWRDLLIRALIVPLVCQISYSFQDLYDFRVTASRNETSVGLMQAVFYAGILVALVYYGLHHLAHRLEVETPSLWTARPWTTLAALVVTLPLSYGYRLAFHWTFSRGQFRHRVLLLGNGAMAKTLEDEISHSRDPGYQIVGYVGKVAGSEDELQARALGEMADVCEVAQKHRVNTVAVTLSERRGRLPTLELLNCRLAGIRVEEGELLYERLTGRIAVQRLRPSYLIFSEGFQHSKTAFAVKRLMDVVLAIVGLILLSPLCGLIALIIKLDSKGPVFYGQTRVGKDGQVFTAYKFRSMRADAEKAGPKWASKNDSRVTRIGAFIRRTRIDEIPQMWNVLKNEMSFVGPRPERPFFVEELRKEIPYYMERLLVKPGITGWAQINYQYGSSIQDAVTKLQYDLYYIKHLSFYLDLVTLLGTVKVVVLRRGAV